MLVMGCRSTKHLNSVSDDVVQVDDVIDDNNLPDKNGNNNSKRQQRKQNGKLFMQKNLKEMGRNTGRGNSNKAPYSQSQLDFFEMLDKKIMEGKDSSEDKTESLTTNRNSITEEER